MKEDFDKNENNKGKVTKPLQEITEQELHNSIENMAKVAPNNKLRFSVLRMQKDYLDKKLERENWKNEKNYWFLMGQNKGMFRDTSLREQNANFETKEALLRAKTKAAIKDFYHQNYSLSKTFKVDAVKEKPKVKIAALEKETPKENKTVKEAKPIPKISEQELQNSIENYAKVAPNKELRFKIREFQKTHLIHKEAREKLQDAKENWAAMHNGKGVIPNNSLTKSREKSEANQALLRTKTKEMVKNFYHQNYSVTKSFNEVGKEKPKDKGLDMDKG